MHLYIIICQCTVEGYLNGGFHVRNVRSQPIHLQHVYKLGYTLTCSLSSKIGASRTAYVGNYPSPLFRGLIELKAQSGGPSLTDIHAWPRVAPTVTHHTCQSVTAGSRKNDDVAGPGQAHKRSRNHEARHRHRQILISSCSNHQPPLCFIFATTSKLLID